MRDGNSGKSQDLLDFMHSCVVQHLPFPGRPI
jgi:hypothetical protein